MCQNWNNLRYNLATCRVPWFCYDGPRSRVGLASRIRHVSALNTTLRTLVAPPVGGALYARFGFRAPFIFGIIVAAFDLLGRAFIIERKDALRWGHDPWLSEGTRSASGNIISP